MTNSPLYKLLRTMDAENILFAYRGEINSELLEAVYAMMDRHLEEKRTSLYKKKKFFHILIEALQNVFHHQADAPKRSNETNFGLSGFIITGEEDNSYNIITGNYIPNADVESLRARLDQVNNLSPDALKNKYQESLAGNELSEKGGAGLGIIEMARKSGNKLNYEFTNINDEYSFFSLQIKI